MSLHTLESPASVAIVDLYLARGRLRAEVPMLGFSRLSDVFNNAPGEFIAASMRMTSTISHGGGGGGGGGGGDVRRHLVVRLRDVRLVRPIAEHTGPVWLAAHRERVSTRVVIDLDDWQVTGDIHLVDRIPWLDIAAAVQHRFVSVSNVSVRFVGVAEPLECDYLLVNGARISALYEVV